MKPKVVIIGAGPAGLTAGYLLSKNDVDVLVLEADPVYVGGISRTATYRGFHFDIGGHAFLSKFSTGPCLWHAVFAAAEAIRRVSGGHIFYAAHVVFIPRTPATSRTHTA